MSASFTPGPWEPRRCGALRPNCWNVTAIIPTAPDEIQKIQTIDQVLDYQGAENAEANARLIATAPDLLAALRELLEASEISADDLPRHEYEAIVEDAQSRARKAIAKAVAA